MCGIAGIFHPQQGTPADADHVRLMLEAMRYRGPDHLGIFADPQLVMGNVRLAIQGVDETGNQPIYNEDTTVVTVFNGEIYNYPDLHRELVAKGHKFSSKTDTELLVHLYEEHGHEFARRLNGMFAFALYDRGSKRFILGRDRSAQKPLFIAQTDRRLIFASELKALLPYLERVKLDPESVYEFLSMGYVLEPHSILEGVRTLEPGTVEVFDDQNPKQFVYWEPQRHTELFHSMDQWLEAALPTLRSALKRHLLSDVPVTMFLSGGIDSSLLTLAAVNESTIREVYTGSFADTPDHDEYQYANSLASACSLRCNRVDMSRNVLAKHLTEYVSSLSQPSGDYSGLATYVLAKETSKDYRVVLGADGGDELFGGYPTYLLPRIRRKYGWLPGPLIKLGWQLSRLFSDQQRYMSLSFKLQQLSQAWNCSHAEAHFRLKCFLPDEAMGLVNPAYRKGNDRSVLFFEKLFHEFGSSDVSKTLGMIDFTTFLRSCTIPKLERNTMHFSIEARLPFLDNELIDLSERTPSSLRFNGNQLKSPLRRALEELRRTVLPEYRVETNPRKQGFSPPLRRMLDEELRQWRTEMLAWKSGLFAPDCYQQIETLRRRGWDTHRLEWNICVLNHWCQENQIAA